MEDTVQNAVVPGTMASSLAASWQRGREAVEVGSTAGVGHCRALGCYDQASFADRAYCHEPVLLEVWRNVHKPF